MFLWMLLACVIGYERDGGTTTLSFEQTKSAHYYNYDKAIISSLKVVSLDDKGEIAGHGSGNYFKIGQHKFIVTAAHVVQEDLSVVVFDYGHIVNLKLIYKDVENDIAFLSAEKDLNTVKAVDYRVNKQLNLTGEEVVYAGFPAELSKSVFHGSVASCSSSDLMMQSFALPGASGSVVFDNKGMVVGVVSALKIGYHEISPFPQLHAGLVYVSRLRIFDRYKIEEIIVKWKSSQ